VSSTTTGEPPPNTPENLVASASSTTQVNLSWTDKSDNENWFRIERKVGSGNFELLIDVAPNLTSHSDTGLTPSTSYTYRIRSASAAGLSQPSNESEVTTPNVPVPAAPSNLQNTGFGLSLISLSWTDNANDESGYRVQRKVGDGEFIQIAELAAGSTSFNDTEVTELETYFYLVYAFNSNGVSAFSNLAQVDLPFFSPTNLTVQGISSTQVELNWFDNSEVETGYRIERKIGSGPYITIVNVGNSVSSFSDLTVNPATNYTYRIRGISFSFFSEYSNEATITSPDLVPPIAPSSLAITGQGLDHVIFQWIDNSSDESGFRVERKTGTGGFETLATLEPEVTTFTDNQVDELGIYTFRVVSFNDAGNSTPTNEVSTQIEFNHPTNLVALAISSTQIDLTWDDNSSAESGYRIERKSALGDFETLSTLGADSSSFSDSNVDPLATYTYRVVAISGAMESNPTNEASANTPNLPIPGSPDNLVANLIDATYVALSWTDNSIDENGFRIERMVGTGAWSELIQVAANTTVFMDSAVGELETYLYRVVAFNDGGDSSASNVASVDFPFVPPSNLTAQASGESQIDITWDDNSLVETGYQVERISGEGTFEVIFTTEAGTSAFTDSNVVVDILYTYRVLGTYVGGKSSPTNEASATTTADVIIPNAPTGLVAIAIDYDQIQLTWTDNADNESGFRIERKLGAEGVFEFIGNAPTDSTTFADNNLLPDTSYHYRIASYVDGAQSSEVTVEVSVTTSSIPLPEAPSGLEGASQTVGIVSLAWIDNSSIESGFRIQRKVGAGEFADFASVNQNTTLFNDSTVSEIQTYRYRIVSYNNVGDSATSNEVFVRIPFAAPNQLVATATAPDTVTLRWVAPSLIETGYRIQRKTSFGSWENVGQLGADSLSFIDNGTQADTTYSYRVVALLSNLESGPSNVVNVTTPNIVPPNAPSDLLIESLSETSISIAWTDNSSNEDGFRILRKEVSSGVWIEIASLAADVNLFVDNSVLPGVSYSYQVFAFNGGGEEVPAESEFRIPIAGRLINISTRGLVEAGDNVMIGSFIIQGDGPKTVLIRGIGPSIM
jgi:hypothetical protein